VIRLGSGAIRRSRLAASDAARFALATEADGSELAERLDAHRKLQMAA
jgi:hypothetical protein